MYSSPGTFSNTNIHFLSPVRDLMFIERVFPNYLSPVRDEISISKKHTINSFPLK
jgi:hypothetical protein